MSATAPSPARIHEGARNDTLFRAASQMWRTGRLTDDEITAVLSVRNTARCEPPLDAHEISEIVQSAARYAPDPVAQQQRVILRRARDVTAPPVTWHIESLVPSGMMSILGGRDGLGKTLLALEMTFATLIGRPFLGRFVTRQGPVIAVLLDDPRSLVVERLATLGIREAGGLWLATADDVKLDDPIKMLEELEQQAIERGAMLIIIDALYCLMPTTSDAGNDAARMRPVLDALNKLAEHTGAAVLLIAHDRKSGDDVAGSYAIRAAAKVILRLVLPQGSNVDPDEGPTTNERVLQMGKSKLSATSAYRLRLHGPGHWELLGTQREVRERERTADADDLKARVLDTITQAGQQEPPVYLTVPEIARAVSRKDDAVRVVLSQLSAANQIERIPALGGGRGRRREEYRVRRDGNSPNASGRTEIRA